MILYVILVFAAVSVTCQDILKSKFNQKCNNGIFLFSAIISLTSMLFFIIVNRDWSYDLNQLIYSISFALCYASSTVFAVLAIKYGSLAKTTLIISCSLLIPSFYGLIFIREPIGIFLVLGTILLIVSLFMINYENSNIQITRKWIVFVTLAFLGNGMCSTVQKIEQNIFGNNGQNVFMIVALAMVTLMLFTVSIMSDEKQDRKIPIIKISFIFGGLCGVFNGLCNYLVLYLNPRIPASVMFPVISSASVVLTFLYATLINCEKFSLIQKIGYAIGAASLVLLNL